MKYVFSCGPLYLVVIAFLFKRQSVSYILIFMLLLNRSRLASFSQYFKRINELGWHENFGTRFEKE